MAIRQVGPAPVYQHEPNFLSNLDCTSLTYRTSDSNTMRTGCFTETAFGLMDSDHATVLFNGTDEAVSLTGYWPQDSLVPWPKAGVLLDLNPVSTGGSILDLYTYPLAHMQDQRNALLQLIKKHVTVVPNLALKDPNGLPLVVNPQTMAFSDNGSWLAAETLSGAFVRINLATLDVVAFAPAINTEGSPALVQSQVAVSDDGRYIAIANKVGRFFAVYDLTDCSSGSSFFAGRCPAHDYWSFAQQQIAGLTAVRHLRFVNDDLLSFEAQPTGSTTNNVYELAPETSIRFLTDYLGLGDSYTSGEGAFDYLAGTDTKANSCHLSVHSYPLLLAGDLFGQNGGHSVACSGAVINDITSMSLDYRGQVKDGSSWQEFQSAQAEELAKVMGGYSPGYVAQQRFAQEYQPRLVTVSVGGNDIGFGDILQKCVMPHVSLRPDDNTCYSTYEDRLEVTNLIDRTVARLTTMYRQLQTEAPGSTLFVIGYPQVADPAGNCALNVHLNRAELTFSAALIDYLDNAISQAAISAGARYVDISQALAGHRLCEAAGYDVAVNGLTAGRDAGPLDLAVLGRESYHPNALGHSLIEQAILKATHNLAIAPEPALPEPSSILDAPRSGRLTNVLVPDDHLTPVFATAGLPMSVHANGQLDGLSPGVTYAIRLDGSDGPTLAHATSDGEGNISTTVSLSPGILSGEHTLDVTGYNQTGRSVNVTQPVYVTAGNDDSDGDGIPDSLDTCPTAVNSGHDSDHDGIDDTCDNLIGVPADGRSRLPRRPPPTNHEIGENSQAVMVAVQPRSSAAKPVPQPRLSFGRAGHMNDTVGFRTDNPPLSTALVGQPLSRLSWQSVLALAVSLWLVVLLARYLWKCIKTKRFRLK